MSTTSSSLLDSTDTSLFEDDYAYYSDDSIQSDNLQKRFSTLSLGTNQNEKKFTVGDQQINQPNLMSQGPSTCNTVKKLIKKLSEQLKPSKFNDFLRINLELISQMPQAINSFTSSKSYYCFICDLVLTEENSWTEHYTTNHSNINDPSVFYCAFCHVYHISFCTNVKTHVKSLEHKVMVDFQEYMKKELVKPNIDNSSEISNEKNKTENNNTSEKSCKPKQALKNKNVYLEIKNISAEWKKNHLKQIISKNYGQFNWISNKKNSFIIRLHHKEGVDAVMKNRDELEKQYDIKIQTFEQDSESKLSPETIQLFSSDYQILFTKMFDLINTMKVTSEDPTEKNKLNKLCDTVQNLGITFDLSKVHVFGSRVYGLALKNSDVDLYLDIGNSFNGQISNDVNRQVSLVKHFAQQCLNHTSEFQNVEQICNARVPILKFYHVPTKLNCDLSFKSGMSTSNTELIKYYLSINNQVHWLVTSIVKYWALQNGLKHRQLFTSYALVWLVLFYLMSVNIVPPLVKLMNMVPKENRITIEGWDCSFGKLPKPNTTEYKRLNLLYGFFQYYSDKKKFKSQVLCSFTGNCMKKFNFFSDFINLSEINKTQRTKFITLEREIYKSFENFYGLTLQDPFDLSFNITKNITGDTLTRFCNMCYETMVLMDNMAVDKNQ